MLTHPSSNKETALVIPALFYSHYMPGAEFKRRACFVAFQ
jgi:hypothetical protein